MTSPYFDLSCRPTALHAIAHPFFPPQLPRGRVQPPAGRPGVDILGTKRKIIGAREIDTRPRAAVHARAPSSCVHVPSVVTTDLAERESRCNDVKLHCTLRNSSSTYVELCKGVTKKKKKRLAKVLIAIPSHAAELQSPLIIDNEEREYQANQFFI